MKREITIYLVRHGESEQNAGLISGQVPDHAISLTEKGIKQAKLSADELMKHLRNTEKNYRVWSSPYKRARQTAEIIMNTMQSKGLHCDYREDAMLSELDFGQFHSLSDNELESQFPSEYAKYAIDRKFKGKFFARKPHGESPLDVEMRIRIFLESLFRDFNSGKTDTVIVVCHGALMKVFLQCH